MAETKREHPTRWRAQDTHTPPFARRTEGAEGGEEVIREYTDGTGVWAFGVGGEGVTGFGFFYDYELFFIIGLFCYQRGREIK